MAVRGAVAPRITRASIASMRLRATLARMNLIAYFRTGLLVLLAGVAALAHAGEKIGLPVREALARDGSVRVMVVLAERPVEEAAKSPGLDARLDAALARASKRGRAAVQRRFDALASLALELDRAALDALAADPAVSRIDLDLPGGGHMAEAAPLAGIDAPRAEGLDGRGIKVGVIDSGALLAHADFAGRIVGQQCFCARARGPGGCCPNGQATQSGPGAALDQHGHGTNVTGIAAGGGAIARPGVASASDIVLVRTLDSENRFCCTSDIVAALDWIRVHHPDTRVINASVGTGALFERACDTADASTTALARALDALRANGTSVTVSAGNQGSRVAIAAPACVRSAIAVGAVWDANLEPLSFLGCTDTPTRDQPACFSNSSAGVDLYAPGAFVRSSGLNGATSSFGGTSQAAPLVAGCIALMHQAVPGATPAAIEAALAQTPASVVDPKNGMAFPRLDCGASIAALRAATGYRIGADSSGAFFVPSQPGHGYFVEVIGTAAAPQVAVSWYVYADGAPRWLIGTAPADGARAVVPMYTARGGAFPPAFAASQVTLQRWGTLTLEYAGRDAMAARWQASLPGFGDGALSLTRLTLAANDADAPAGRIAACHSGSWYDAANPGHGLQLEVLGTGVTRTASLVWYVFQGGEQRWLIGQGPIAGDTARIALHSARGAQFPPAFDPADVALTPWGELTFTAIDADRARIAWAPTQPGYAPGALELVRLTSLLGRRCP